MRNKLSIIIYALLFILCSCGQEIADVNPKNFVVSNTSEGIVISSYLGNASHVEIPSSISGSKVVGVGDEAFKNNKSLRSIVLPETIQVIGDSAFADCVNLEHITLSEGLKEIGSFALSNCINVDTLYIPETLMYVGDMVFSGWKSPQEIHISENADMTHWSNVYDLDRDGSGIEARIDIERDYYELSWKDAGDAISITGVIGTSTCIDIPMFINNKPVVEICNNAFENCSHLEKINLCSNVKKIGEKAFANCMGISDLEISENVLFVGSNAFQGWKAEQNINIENGLDRSAWDKDWNTGSIANIDSEWYRISFIGTDLDYLMVKSGETYVVPMIEKEGFKLSSITGNNGTIYKAGDSIVVDRDFILSWNWLELFSIQFVGTTLDKVIVTSGTSYTIPSINNEGYILLSIIDNEGSEYHPGDIIIIDNNTVLTWTWDKISCSISFDGIDINNVTVEWGSTFTIPDYTKNGFTLSCIKDENGKVYHVGDVIRITTDITFFYDWVSVSNYEDFVYEIKNDHIVITGYKGTDSDVVIPDKIQGVRVSEISDYAFTNKNGIERITIPNSITVIGNNAFDGCLLLSKVSLPATLQSLGDYAFFNCKQLESIVIPNTLGSIPKSCFANCTSMTNVTLGECITSIADSAFNSCSNLNEIILPDSISYIGNYAFYNCSNVARIHLSQNIEYIGEKAFWHCKKIVTVNIPKSVSYIGSGAFGFDNTCLINLEKDIKNQRWAPYWYRGDNYYYDPIIRYDYLPEYHMSFSMKDNKYGVRSFGDDVEFIEIPNQIDGIPVSFIEQKAFYNTKNLKTVVIPDSVASINSHAFYNCRSIQRVDIPTSVGYVDSSAFYELNRDSVINIAYGCDTTRWHTNWNLGCRAKVNKGYIEGCDFCVTDKGDSVEINAYIGDSPNVVIPNEIQGKPVTAIGDNAFSNQTQIVSIAIPSNIKTIGNRAFSGCTGMSKIELNQNIESIGSDVFSGWTATQVVTVVAGTEIELWGNEWRNNSNAQFDVEKFTIEFIGISKDPLIVERGSTFIIPEIKIPGYSLDSLTVNDITAHANEGLVVTENCTIKWVWSYGTEIADLSYTLSPDGVTLNGYKGNDSILNIPETIQGKSVISISSSAFMNKKNLSQIAIPNSVTYIGSKAFAGCTGISSMIIPKTVSFIGSDAFSSWNNKQTITVEKGCDNTSWSLDWNRNCNAIVDIEHFSITFVGVDEDSVSLPMGARYEVPAAKREGYHIGQVLNNGKRVTVGSVITISSDTTLKYDWDWGSPLEDFEYHIISDSEICIDGYKGSDTIVHIPSEWSGKPVTEISGNAFWHADRVNRIVIPNSIKRVGSTAFYLWSGTILIETGIDKSQWNSHWNQNTYASIKENYYRDCNFLGIVKDGEFTITGYIGTDVYLSIPEQLQNAVVTTISGYGFKDNKILKGISFPSRLERIESGVFEGCSAIESIYLNSSIKYVGDYAFHGWSNAQNINIAPNTDTSLWAEYWNSTSAQINIGYVEGSKFLFEEVGNKYSVIGYMGGDTYITVPNNFKGVEIISIGNNAFAYNDQIVNIYLSEGIESIGDNAFAGCSNLVNINIPTSVGSIGSGAFSACNSLTSFCVPYTVKSLGTGVFSSCENLQDISFLNPDTTLGDASFSQCLKLKTVSLPSNLKKISAYMFNNCRGLESVILPSSVISIEESAFDYCYNLKSIRGMENIESIGKYAFCNCWDLEEIVLPETLNKIGLCAFCNCNRISQIIIPVKCCLDASVFGDWKAEQKIFVHMDNDHANWSSDWSSGSKAQIFEGYVSESEFLIKRSSFDTVDIIGYRGDNPDVVIPDTIIDCTVSQISITDNPIITSVILPSTVSETGTFKNCKNLTSVTIPSNITKVSYMAFDCCDSLKNINLSHNITSIDAYAFEGCTSLSKLIIPNSVKEVGYAACRFGREQIIYLEYGTDTSNWDRDWLGYGQVPYYGYVYDTDFCIGHLDAETCSISRYLGNDAELVIPSMLASRKVISISSYAFESDNCRSIKNIYIPIAISNIGDKVFSGWTSGQTINIEASKEFIDANWYSGWSAGCSAIVNYNFVL